MNELIIVAGPTAVGKSACAIRLCQKIDGCVISADSMQVYKGMDIGTAKVSSTEMQGIEHYLIDILNPSSKYDVFSFKKHAKSALDQIYKKGKIPVMAGGTGFYIQSVLYDIDFSEEKSNTRKDLEEIAQTSDGPEKLYQKLCEIDPESAKIIHQNNVKRVIRAIEFFEENGYCISVHNKTQAEKKSPYKNAYFVLNDDREYIYKKCDLRVDNMIDSGLIEEVSQLMKEGYLENTTSMQALGYKEIVKYLKGEYSLDEAIYVLKRDTRHFVKRQITYFKREKDAIWLDLRDYDRDIEKITDKMKEILYEKGIIRAI